MSHISMTRDVRLACIDFFKEARDLAVRRRDSDADNASTGREVATRGRSMGDNHPLRRRP
jgi:hypothetical protein